MMMKCFQEMGYMGSKEENSGHPGGNMGHQFGYGMVKAIER